MDLPPDFNPIQALIDMITSLIWFSAAVGVVYDFIRYISRANGLATIWRHAFESIILLLSGTYGWTWMEDLGTDHPAYLLAGRIIVVLSLMAYVYSSYRKGLTSLWIEITLNCFLFAGLSFSIFCALTADDGSVNIFLGLPINILFIHALLANYNQLRARYTFLPNGE